MAEIKISAMCHFHGPDIPTQHYATIKQRPWPNGGTVPVLYLEIGSDQVEVWPFDCDYIEALGHKLIDLAKHQRKADEQERQEREKVKHGKVD